MPKTSYSQAKDNPLLARAAHYRHQNKKNINEDFNVAVVKVEVGNPPTVVEVASQSGGIQTQAYHSERMALAYAIKKLIDQNLIKRPKNKGFGLYEWVEQVGGPPPKIANIEKLIKEKYGLTKEMFDPYKEELKKQKISVFTEREPCSRGNNSCKDFLEGFGVKNQDIYFCVEYDEGAADEHTEKTRMTKALKTEIMHATDFVEGRRQTDIQGVFGKKNDKQDPAQQRKIDHPSSPSSMPVNITLTSQIPQSSENAKRVKLEDTLVSSSNMISSPLVAHATQSTPSDKLVSNEFTMSTEGLGDCAFHAIFGEWDGVSQKFLDPKFEDRRNKLANWIRNNSNNSTIQPMLIQAIMALIEEKIRNPNTLDLVSPEKAQVLENLRERYKKYGITDHDCLSTEVINAYAAMIDATGTYLAQADVNLIAYCFDIPVEYKTGTGDFCEILNPDGGSGAKVTIRFNGTNHYERVLNNEQFSALKGKQHGQRWSVEGQSSKLDGSMSPQINSQPQKPLGISSITKLQDSIPLPHQEQIIKNYQEDLNKKTSKDYVDDDIYAFDDGDIISDEEDSEQQYKIDRPELSSSNLSSRLIPSSKAFHPPTSVDPGRRNTLGSAASTSTDFTSSLLKLRKDSADAQRTMSSDEGLGKSEESSKITPLHEMSKPQSANPAQSSLKNDRPPIRLSLLKTYSSKEMSAEKSKELQEKLKAERFDDIHTITAIQLRPSDNDSYQIIVKSYKKNDIEKAEEIINNHLKSGFGLN
jgi:hypothetical protein